MVRCFIFNSLLKPEIILKWGLEAVRCYFKLALIGVDILTGQILLSHWNCGFCALWGEMKLVCNKGNGGCIINEMEDCRKTKEAISWSRCFNATLEKLG